MPALPKVNGCARSLPSRAFRSTVWARDVRCVFGSVVRTDSSIHEGAPVAPNESGSVMRDADLVLEGGGIKGAGLVGAVTALMAGDDGYRFRRLAGTSAGAIVAALLASGMDPQRLRHTMDTLDFSRFRDLNPLYRFTPRLGAGLGLIFQRGMYRGDYLYRWLLQTLAEQGVHTWADLKEADADSSLPEAQRYRLVVVVSDVSRGQMLRLPWDYQSQLGLNPDTQLVADAVRASASIPFFFRPVPIMAGPSIVETRILCADGGLLSNYPIDVFDRTDGDAARWPTLGVKLSAKTGTDGPWKSNRNALELAKSVFQTMQSAHDRLHISDPSAIARTTWVDTTGFAATDFSLTQHAKDTLFSNGHHAAEQFLATWRWEDWTQRFTARSAPGASADTD